MSFADSALLIVILPALVTVFTGLQFYLFAAVCHEGFPWQYSRSSVA
jgi:hypothetical protein